MIIHNHIYIYIYIYIYIIIHIYICRWARVPGEGDGVADVLDARRQHDQALEAEAEASAAA